MPRPLRPEDLKSMKDRGMWSTDLKWVKDPVLGFFIHDDMEYAYQWDDRERYPKWVTAKTFKRRQVTGHPSPRRTKAKPMQEGMFSLDEMAIAEAIINGG